MLPPEDAKNFEVNRLEVPSLRIGVSIGTETAQVKLRQRTDRQRMEDVVHLE